MVKAFFNVATVLTAAGVAVSGVYAGPAGTRAFPAGQGSASVASTEKQPKVQRNNVVAHKRASKMNRPQEDDGLEKRSFIHSEGKFMKEVGKIIDGIKGVKNDEQEIPLVFEDLRNLKKGPHPKKNDNPEHARSYGHAHATNKDQAILQKREPLNVFQFLKGVMPEGTFDHKEVTRIFYHVGSYLNEAK